jgi:hypothetical protein
MVGDDGRAFFEGEGSGFEVRGWWLGYRVV